MTPAAGGAFGRFSGIAQYGREGTEEKKAPEFYPSTNTMSDSSSSGLGLKSATQKIGWFTASCVLVSNIIGGGSSPPRDRWPAVSAIRC